MGWRDDAPAEGVEAPKQEYTPAGFAATYGELAKKAGAELGIDPNLILSQWGLETGWGKRIVQGTYNIGNIKDLSGKGVRAKDKVEGSNDAYLKFEDPETFGTYYTDFIKRLYPEAVGAGSDVKKFSSGLESGKMGSYATDPNYHLKLSSTYRSLSSLGQDSENPFARVQLSTPEQLKKVSEVGPPIEEPDTVDPETAALAGAGVGLVTGTLSAKAKLPSDAKYAAAQEKVNVARDKLAEVQRRAAGNPAALEQEFRRAQTAYTQAERDLLAAQDELRALRGSAPAAAEAAAEAVPSRTVPGSSGHANWTRAMADEIPDVIAESATSMRKSDPTGGQALIDKDVAARKKLSQMGMGDYRLSGSGPGQLALPPEVAAQRAAEMEAELVQRQAQEAAERTAQAERAALEQQRAQARVQQAREARRTAGEARGAASRAMTQAQRDAAAVNKAQSAVSVAQSAASRVPNVEKPGPLAIAGEKAAKVLPRTLGALSGAATAYTGAEAINEWNKWYENYKATGKAGPMDVALLKTAEAIFGGLSMLPPYTPITAAGRVIGTIGSLGFAAYEMSKNAPQGEAPPSPDYVAP